MKGLQTTKPGWQDSNSGPIYKNIMEMTADGQVVSMAIAKVKQLQRRQQQPQSPEQEEEADIDVRPNCSNEQIEEEEDLEQDEE